MAPLQDLNCSDHICANCWMNADRMCMNCCAEQSTDKETTSTNDKNTYYCSSECQESARSSHEEECNSLQARKQLFRLANTLQKIFYAYREVMYDKIVVKIEKKGVKVYIFEGQRTTLCRQPVDVLVPFPQELFCSEDEIQAAVAQIIAQSQNKHALNKASTEGASQVTDGTKEALREQAQQMLGSLDQYYKNAVLVHNSCDDAVAWMLKVIKHLFGDLVSSYSEVLCKPKGSRIDLVAVKYTGQERHSSEIDLDHSILKIQMKDTDEYYVLDLTGAQYGHTNPLTPWDEYKRTRIERIIARYPFGENREYLQKLADQESIICRMNSFTAAVLDLCPTIWEKETSISWKNVRKLPLEEYKEYEESLLGCIQKHLRELIEMHRL